MLHAEVNLLNLLRGRGASLETLRGAGPLPDAITAEQRGLERVADALRALDSADPAAADDVLAHLEAAARIIPAQRARLHASAAIYRRLLNRQSNNAAALAGLARALADLGQPDAAAGHYRDALRIDPGHPGALAGLAAVLTNHPDPAVRDPLEAVRLAREAVQRTRLRDPRALTVLADAYAAAGRLDLAATSARAALALAEAVPDEALAAELRARLNALGRTGVLLGRDDSARVP
jgi:tetratricopeptide (TPR) repeat protein